MKKKQIKSAVALSYQKDRDTAPKLVAKGKGRLAEMLIALAADHDIPLYEDQDLVKVLEAMDLDTEIPPDLYRAVAEVLVFIYRLNGNYSK